MGLDRQGEDAFLECCSCISDKILDLGTKVILFHAMNSAQQRAARGIRWE